MHVEKNWVYSYIKAKYTLERELLISHELNYMNKKIVNSFMFWNHTF